MKLVEGVDYYMEDGLFVLTEAYLRRRGKCCNNRCRHCPWGYGRISHQDSGITSSINPTGAGMEPDDLSEKS